MSSMKKLIPIVGTLGLAIAGSALWEALRKPIIFASFVMLKLVTLGIDSFRDSIMQMQRPKYPREQVLWFLHWLQELSRESLVPL